MENHVFILHEKVPVQRPGLQEIAGTYIPAHHVRQFQPLGFSENLMPISMTQHAVNRLLISCLSSGALGTANPTA